MRPPFLGPKSWTFEVPTFRVNFGKNKDLPKFDLEVNRRSLFSVITSQVKVQEDTKSKC